MSSVYLVRCANAYRGFYEKNITGEKNRFKRSYNKFKAVAHNNVCVWTYHFLKTVQVCCDDGDPWRVPAEESAALKNILISFQ